MRNAALAVLFVGLLAISWLTFTEKTALDSQAKSIAEIQSQLQEQRRAPKAASLDLQERCAKQARSEFSNLGWDKDPSATYTNHYSAKLNRCFMLIENTQPVGKEFMTTRNLSDAYEGKVYGDWIWVTQPNKKYWEVPPRSCSVMTSDGEMKLCSSEEEWNQLIALWMEDR